MTTFTINGVRQEVDAAPDMPLLWVMRDILGITGPKFGCGAGICGNCTVQMDGFMTRSCVLPLDAVEGAEIVTIEGIAEDPIGAVVQDAWRTREVAQCGYCQPGQIMSAVELLRDTPEPSDADIDAAMSNTLCRCATYNRIRAAIHDAAGSLPTRDAMVREG